MLRLTTDNYGVLAACAHELKSNDTEFPSFLQMGTHHFVSPKNPVLLKWSNSDKFLFYGHYTSMFARGNDSASYQGA